VISFKGAHFPKGVILMVIRWYLAYPLSYRNVEDFIKERGISVDHATVNRWVIKYGPLLEMRARKFRKASAKSWKMDETYIKVKGKWCYYYRAVDTNGYTIDFFLSQKRDKEAAKAFLDKAIAMHGLPDKVSIDKSGSNLAALVSINIELEPSKQMLIRQIKYLNNLIEQDHRAVKRITRPMMGFKNINSAYATLSGIELCHMIRKKQLVFNNSLPAWKQFYALAG
jgi:putative transposase